MSHASAPPATRARRPAGRASGTPIAPSPKEPVESVKSVSEVYAPVSVRVTALDPELEGEPEPVDTDSYGDGRIAEIEAE